MSRRRSGRGGGPDPKKDLQLCAEVRNTLALVLGDADDPVLHNCDVTSVEPAPSAARLRVVIAAPSGVDPDDVYERLHTHHGELRREVAEFVDRRRAPDLLWVVLPRSLSTDEDTGGESGGGDALS